MLVDLQVSDVPSRLSKKYSTYHSQCPHIRWLSLVWLSAQYIWRNVGWRSALIMQQIIFVQQILSQTEIDDFDFIGMLVQYNVSQFQVTVDDVAFVKTLHH